MYKCITNDFKSMYYTCTLYMYYTLMLLAICCQQIGGYMSVANVNCCCGMCDVQMYYKWFQEYVLYMYIVHVLYINVIGYMLSTNWGIYVSCECKLYIVHWKLDISSGGYMSVANVNCTLYIGSWIYHKGGGG